MQIADALARAAARLPGDEARREAELLLAHALGRPRSYLYAWPERQLSEQELARFEPLLERRAAGQPIAYLLGRREFWSLELAVSPATLIPRPDTELLIEQALALIPPNAQWQLADLGTGSGAIALALAHERPRCRLVATDISPEALAVARGNAERLGISNVTFRQGSWFTALGKEHYHLIASNPPYIAAGDPHLAQGDLRFEPASALAAGPDGLVDLRALAAGAPQFLRPGGWLLLEHGYDQGEAVRRLLEGAGFQEIVSRCDLQGHERITLGRLSLG